MNSFPAASCQPQAPASMASDIRCNDRHAPHKSESMVETLVRTALTPQAKESLRSCLKRLTVSRGFRCVEALRAEDPLHTLYAALCFRAAYSCIGWAPCVTWNYRAKSGQVHPCSLTSSQTPYTQQGSRVQTCRSAAVLQSSGMLMWDLRMHWSAFSTAL